MEVKTTTRGVLLIPDKDKLIKDTITNKTYSVVETTGFDVNKFVEVDKNERTEDNQ